MPQIRTPVQPNESNIMELIRIATRAVFATLLKFIFTLGLLKLSRYLLAALASLSPVIPVVIRQMVTSAVAYVASMLPVLVVSSLSLVATIIPVLLAFGFVRRFVFKPAGDAVDDFAGAAVTTMATAAINPAAGAFDLAAFAAFGSTLVENVNGYLDGKFEREKQILAQSIISHIEEYANDAPLIKAAINAELNRPDLDINNFSLVYLLLSQDPRNGMYKATIVPFNNENDKIYSFKARVNSPAGIDVKDPVTNNPVIAWGAQPIMILRGEWGNLNPTVNLNAYQVQGPVYMHGQEGEVFSERFSPAQDLHGQRAARSRVQIEQLADDALPPAGRIRSPVRSTARLYE